MHRRELLTLTVMAGAGAAVNRLLDPVRAVAAAVKPVKIRNIETFNIEIPAAPAEVEAGVMSRINVTRVSTESGVRGYSFGGAGGGGATPRRRTAAGAGGGGPAGFQQIRDALVGTDVFALEQHLK